MEWHLLSIPNITNHTSQIITWLSPLFLDNLYLTLELWLLSPGHCKDLHFQPTLKVNRGKPLYSLRKYQYIHDYLRTVHLFRKFNTYLHIHLPRWFHFPKHLINFEGLYRLFYTGFARTKMNKWSVLNVLLVFDSINLNRRERKRHT